MDQEKSHRLSWLADRKKNNRRVTIGFTGISNFRSFIGQEYLAGVMQAASDYDLNLINFLGFIKYTLLDDIDFFRHYLKKFRFMRPQVIDGLVTWAASLTLVTDADTAARTFEELKPLPMVDVGFRLVEGIPSVRIDNIPAIHSLMSHLIEHHGYTRFAYVGNSDIQPHHARCEIWKAELAHYGIAELEDAVFFTPNMNSREVSLCVDKLCNRFNIHNRQDLDVIVTPSDIVAAELVGELGKRGITVPRDVAVTGFNNQYEGLTTLPPLTTIDPEFRKRGYIAVEMLVDSLMKPDKIVENRTIPASLILRQSCGCYEESITKAGKTDLPHAATSSDTEVTMSETEKFASHIAQCFPALPAARKDAFAQSLLHDLKSDEEQPSLLAEFRIFMEEKIFQSFKTGEAQQFVSALRACMLPCAEGNMHRLQKIENTIHQIRVMIAMQNEYRLLAQPGNADPLNHKTHIAMRLAAAVDRKQFLDMLKYQLGELEIPGIMLALEENMTPDLESVHLELVHPEPFPGACDELPVRIADTFFIPKKFFPANRRHTMMFEILYNADRYFGYTLLEMGQSEAAWFDTVRILLGQSLFSIYSREGRIAGRRTLLNKSEIDEIVRVDTSSEANQGKIGAREIIAYLLDHLDAMTDLDLMSTDLGISKSHLIRQSKALTGFPVRMLHEQLKIEQAKKLMLARNIKLSEIASRLGFQNQSYFSAVFKKVTGVSPRDWVRK